MRKAESYNELFSVRYPVTMKFESTKFIIFYDKSRTAPEYVQNRTTDFGICNILKMWTLSALSVNKPIFLVNSALIVW